MVFQLKSKVSFVLLRTTTVYSWKCHYSDAMISAMASEIHGVSTVYSRLCSGVDQRKHQSSASLAFVRGLHRRPVSSPHKGLVTRKMFPFDDVIVYFWIPVYIIQVCCLFVKRMPNYMWFHAMLTSLSGLCVLARNWSKESSEYIRVNHRESSICNVFILPQLLQENPNIQFSVYLLCWAFNVAVAVRWLFGGCIDIGLGAQSTNSHLTEWSRSVVCRSKRNILSYMCTYFKVNKFPSTCMWS